MKKICIATIILFLLLSLSMHAPALAQDQLDLTITDISVYHTYYSEDNKVWEDLDNTVNVTVKNIGSDVASTFKVKLLADGDEVGTETEPGLAAGDNTLVSFTWHPTDTGLYTLEAVADSHGEINESDEENNERTADASVVHNGYMGDKPLITYDHDTITGGIFYTIGDSFYSGKLYSGDTYAVTHDVTIPSGATVKFARLYSYWTWSPTYPSMELAFDDNTVSPDAEYTDRKGEGWGSIYDYPTGTYAYDVSSYVSSSGSYTAVLENTGSDYFCMDGLGLLVVYTDASGSEIEYWVNEGCDMLSTQTDSGGLTPKEATATSVFEGTVDQGSVERASLTTVVQSGCHLETKLMFNDEDWTEVFDGTPYTDLDIDEERDVTDYIVSSDNTVKIEAPAVEDGGGDYLVPSNVFLVLYYEKEEEEEEEFFDTGSPANPYPSIFGIHNGTITPKYDITMSRMYTYPCTGTGGHSEYVAFYNATTGAQIANGTWKGYAVSDYHHIEFDVPFVLYENETYNYTIKTGSYPQIHHTDELEVDGGIIRCMKFTDANGKVYNNWIPAIKLY